MACTRFAGDLTAHAAGAEATPGLRAHLDGCADCRGRLSRERRLVATIDRDLAGALRLEPSVEFEARVRQRVAEEPVGSGVGRTWTISPGWRFALGAVSLVLVAGLAITLALRTGSPRETPASTTSSTKPPAPMPLVAHQEVPVVGQPPAQIAADAGNRQPAVYGHPATVAGRLPTTDYRLPERPNAEPEVLVPPDQRMALNRLLEMMRTGKIDERLLPATQEDVAAPAAQVVAPLVVEDLKVPPITVAATGGTEKQTGSW